MKSQVISGRWALIRLAPAPDRICDDLQRNVHVEAKQVVCNILVNSTIYAVSKIQSGQPSIERTSQEVLVLSDCKP